MKNTCPKMYHVIVIDEKEKTRYKLTDRPQSYDNAIKMMNGLKKREYVSYKLFSA